MSKSKEQNYLHGAAILTAGVVIMKILGFIYKVPLGNMIGDDGYALFLSAYNVYNVFLTLATAGLPVALSRMISEAHTKGCHLQARKTFSVAWWTFFVLGAVSTLIMILFPGWLAGDVLNNPDTEASIVALAPAVLLVCLTSAYRGFCQGYENMIPTTIGQVLEVLVKVIVGLALAWYLVNAGYNKSISAAGAVFGVTAGSLAVLLYMIIYKKRNYKQETVSGDESSESGGEIFKNLIRIGVPIALGASVLSVINVLDSGLCMARLQKGAGYTYQQAKVLYGVYGKAQTLYNLPAAFITPLTISIVPAIAAQIVSKNDKMASKISEDSLRISVAVAMPMAVGLAVLSKPIMQVIYPTANEAGGLLLCLLGIASFPVCFALMSNAVLQASGNEKYPVYSIIIGGVVKIIVNYILVGMADINIYGAPIGTLCCYITMCVMNMIFMFRKLEPNPKLSNIFVRPTLASLIMGVVAFAVYFGSMYILPTDSRLYMLVGMCLAIGVAVVVYGVAVIKLRAITAEDMKLIPKGEKIAGLLHMK